MNSLRNKPLFFMALLLLQVFILLPMSIYLGNPGEMHISAIQYVRLALIPALAFFLLSVFLLSRLEKGRREGMTVWITLLYLIVWIQANVFVWDLGHLDGRQLTFEEDIWRGILDAGFIVFVIALFLKFKSRIESVVCRLAIFLFLAQTVSLFYLVVTDKDHSFISNDQAIFDDYEEILSFSKKSNVLHILLDGFQSDVFLDIVTSEEYGKYYQYHLPGFTYYEETLGSFLFTRFAVPALLSGKLYDNKTPKNDFIEKTLKGHTILNLAANNKHEVDLIVGDAYLARQYANTNYTNFFEIKNNEIIGEAVKLLDLTLLRVSPFFLKPLVFNEQKWLFRSWFLTELPVGEYFSHTVFLNNFINEMKVDRESSVYKYLHVMNTHNPMVVTEDCAYAGGALKISRKNLRAQSRCTLDTLIKLFGKMKELGIYRESLIIVHADHGGWVENRRKGKALYFADSTPVPVYVKSLASPLLMLKLPESDEGFQISRVLASLNDIPDTISDIMAWGAGFGHTSLMKIEPGAMRQRRFRFYYWAENESKRQYTYPIQEFIIRGSHYEEEWELGPILFP